MSRNAMVVSRVVGGELPLTEEDALLWTKGGAPSDASTELLRSLGIEPEAARWLSFGRSAFAVALKAIGLTQGMRLQTPSYFCPVVYDALAQRGAKLEAYPLDARLAPRVDEALSLAEGADVVLTCSYFGAVENDQALGAFCAELKDLSSLPWIIEDRVMASALSVPQAMASMRSDFFVASFRKGYPVPDGALLVAVTPRAREALSAIQEERAAPLAEAVLDKVAAKNKRNSWLSSLPAQDDPTQNGVRESFQSEAAINAICENIQMDNVSGSQASAQWLLGQNLRRNDKILADRFRMVGDVLARFGEHTVPLREGSGIGVPFLVKNRAAFRAAVAEKGLFFPGHWPLGGAQAERLAKHCETARFWYEHELTFPIHVHINDADLDYALQTVDGMLEKYA